MLFVILVVRNISIQEVIGGSNQVGIVLVYTESENDSTGWRLLGSLLNALIFVIMLIVTTVVFVLLYKYRCLKVIYGWLIGSSGLMLAIFGGLMFYLLFATNNLPIDWITYSFIVWNFSIVGLAAIFYYAPTKLNQAYLILVSALLAIFFTRLPEWTTWAILAAIALYDIFAVLCPSGPLKVLVETAQERQEPIPALLYNGSITMMMGTEEQLPEPPKKSVKLGLGDFVFYSVLVGRAAMYDMISVYTCFIAIITGLFFTLILLAIFRKALPALPISIFLGIIFFSLSKIFLVPYTLLLGASGVFV